ncbi:MAG TPA: hypothetical protein VN620_06145 [Candidatus Methylomirabilis sp.]|nr:hypothetical protein [Candidatus Methylomirabilis sp.]
MSTTNKSEIIRAPRINETAPDFAAAHAAPETGAGLTTLDPSIATPRRRSMPDRKLDIAFWNYDRTRLLADGTVKIEGVDAAFHSARIVPEIFKAMIKDRAYDVSELGMTYFLRLFNDDSGLPGPVFPPLGYLHQQKEGHQQTAGPRGQTRRRTGALWPRRRGDAQGRPLRRVWRDA